MTEASEGNVVSTDQPMRESNVTQRPPANFWVRVRAKFADLVVITVGCSILLTLMSLGDMIGIPGLWLLAAVMVTSILFWILYFAWGTSEKRQTWGYRLAGLRAERMDGASLSLKDAAGRAILNGFFYCLINVCGIGLFDYIAAAFGGKRAIHDYMSNSRVVKIAPTSKVLWGVALIGVVLPLALFKSGLIPVQAFFIPSGAMENTLLVGDRLITSKLSYHLIDPAFQDIVVFRAPDIALGGYSPKGVDFIKRCVGVPGDTVYIVNRVLYRGARGKSTFVKVDEFYTKWKKGPGLSVAYDMKIVDGKVYSREYAEPGESGPWRLEGVPLPMSQQFYISNAKPDAVPPGEYLMLGDHRNNSNDGHVWGFVPRANIIGKAMCVYWPLTRLRSLNQGR